LYIHSENHLFDLQMEELVKKFISQQPNGVRISEMEICLKQSRLRLGYVTRKLLNEGKVLKIENKYFPVEESKTEQTK